MLTTRTGAFVLVLSSAAMLLTVTAAPPLAAAPITFESATMGPAGQLSGQTVNATTFVGWRFLVQRKTAVTHVGGHLAGISGNLFAAIVSLSQTSALPQGAPLNDTEVIANTAFTSLLPTSDFRTPLAAVLEPGAYALVFGSGMFNAAGSGLMPSSQQTNIAPTLPASFIMWRQTLPGRYEWTAGAPNNARFVVLGNEFAGPADFNYDGQVNSTDLTIWKANLGGPGSGGTASGDANLDGRVDGADLLMWQRGITQPSSVATAPIPEPASQVILLILSTMAVGVRHWGSGNARAWRR